MTRPDLHPTRTRHPERIDMDMDRIIYIQTDGEMVRVAEPNRPDLANFVITCDGRDWSGFRTLPECERQFGELRRRKGDPFRVVER